MKFSTELNNFILSLGCSAKDISDSSGLSQSIISRYLSGKRVPKLHSNQFTMLVNGLHSIAKKKEIQINKSDINLSLKKSISHGIIDFNDFTINFNTLIKNLKIKLSHLASELNYDPSFISKIKNGTRKPSDLYAFSNYLADYIIKHVKDKDAIASLLRCPKHHLSDDLKYKDLFVKWITGSPDDYNKFIDKLFSSIDSFNLGEYISDDVKTNNIILKNMSYRNNKTYYGIDEIKNAHTHFLSATLDSLPSKSIFFYSNIPMCNLSLDEILGNNWKSHILELIKKGLHLNIVHSLNRPLREIFIGLEYWIPLYMTGAITPYYMETSPFDLFSITHCTSDTVAFHGECITSNPNSMKLHVTTKAEEVTYYKQKSKHLLSNSKPLAIVFNEYNLHKFEAFINKFKKSDVQKIQKSTFKNIDFYLCKNKWISVNKKTSPQMHFVVHYPKLRDALENYLLCP